MRANLMYPFQGDEPEQGVFLGALVKNSVCLHATGVVSEQSAAGTVLQVELEDQKAYSEQSEHITQLHVNQHLALAKLAQIDMT